MILELFSSVEIIKRLGGNMKAYTFAVCNLKM